jgi:glucokinase
VTTPDGLVVSAPPLGWRKMRLGGRLSEELDLPVRVESDVNLAALGELRFGAGRGARDLVWVSVGHTVGAALILDGRLYRGHRGAAGALGGLLPGTSFLDWGERVGPLESLISSAGIADRARVLADAAGLPLPPDGLRPEDVFAAASEGTGWACAVLDETIDYLAVALSAVQGLLDPERVVLGGSAVTAADSLLPALVRRMASLPNPPRLVPSELGARAAVLGAAVAARDGL